MFFLGCYLRSNIFLRILLFQCSVHFCYFQGVPFDLDLNPTLNDNVNSEKLHLRMFLSKFFIVSLY